jgi:hypothetical protein
MAIFISGASYTVNPSPLPISEGGTGQSTAPTAINALLPTQSGQTGKFLTTDGTNVSWATAGGGGGTPGGSTGQIQYNNAGAFAGSSRFTWDNTATAPVLTLTSNSATTATITAGDSGGQNHLRIKAGTPASGDGGNLYLNATDCGTSTSNGGDIQIVAGRTGLNAANAGTIVIRSGSAPSASTTGYIQLANTVNDTPTPRLTINYDGSWSLGAAGTNQGTSGQALVSNGAGSPPTWQTIVSGVSSFNTRTGAVTLTSGDVTSALTYTPVNKAGDTMTGLLVLSGNPTAALGAVTKQYVDAFVTGLNVHMSCVTATTATLASSSGGTVTYNNGTAGVGATLTTTGSFATIGGASTADTNRILVKNEATQANNGIYVRTSSTVLTRADDFDNSPSGEISAGDFTYIQSGTLVGTQWAQTTTGTITVGTTAIVFTQLNGTASSATNIAGGAQYQIPYQSAASTTAFTSALTVVPGSPTTYLYLGETNGTGILQGVTSASATIAGSLQINGGMNTSTGQGGNLNLNGGYAQNGTAGDVNIRGGEKGIAGGGGNIVLLTYPSTGAPVERFRILANGAWSVGTGGAATGTTGQALISNGSASAPTWQNISASSATNIAGGTAGQIPVQSGSGATTFFSGLNFTNSGTPNMLSLGIVSTAVGTLAGADTGNGQNLQVRGGNGTTGTNGSLYLQGGSGPAAGGGYIVFQTASSSSLATRMTITNNGNVLIGSGSALTTTATAGFLSITGSAGTPTGVPTNEGTTTVGITNVPIHCDTTNNTLYFYSTSAWRAVGGSLAGGATGQIPYQSGVGSTTFSSTFTYSGTALSLGSSTSPLILGQTSVATSPQIALTVNSGDVNTANTVGSLTVRGGDQTFASSGQAGGVLTIRGGNSNSSGAGGAVTLSGGSSSSSGAGGSLTINGGTGNGGGAAIIFRTASTTTLAESFRIAPSGAWGVGGANYGTSGQVLTSSGSGGVPTWSAVTVPTQTLIVGTAGATGGAASATGGAGSTGAGGTLTLAGGATASIGNSTAGSVAIAGGAATGSTGSGGNGGSVTINAGTGSVGLGNTSGSITVQAGPSGNGLAAGTVTIAGGDGPSNAGGAVTVRGGNSVTTGSAAGGQLTLAGGTSFGGTAGAIVLQTAATTRMTFTAAGPITTAVGASFDFGSRYTELSTAVTATATTNLDFSLGNNFDITMSASITTITKSNAPASGRVYSMTLFLTQSGAGSFTVAWAGLGTVKWAGGTAPTLTTTTGKTDIIVLVTKDGGTTWYGMVSGQNF